MPPKFEENPQNQEKVIKMAPRIQHIIEGGVEKKRCSSCQTYRSLDNYNSSKQSWDKLRPECKVCLGDRRSKNKDKMTEYNKVYWEKTKEEQKVKSKEWREKNKDYVKAKMKEWLENNKDRKKQMDKEYREANWEKKREYNREWNRKNYNDLKNNPGRANEYRLWLLQKNCARRIREMLKQNKSRRTMDYVGCTLEELKAHLESQFQEGMTWENYGTYVFGNNDSGWHIDHVIPCAAFNFNDETERNACFYYMNLQPLWGKDNIVKSDSYDPDEKEEYLEMYKSRVVDASASVEEGTEDDAEEDDLEKEYDYSAEFEEEVDTLKTENESLKAQLEEAQKMLAKMQSDPSVIQHVV